MEHYNYIKPRILECSRFFSEFESSERIVKDYEIDFNVNSGRTMWVDGQEYVIEPNSVVCRLPGQRVYSSGRYDMYTLTLDFSGQKPPAKQIRHTENPLQPQFLSYYWQTIPVCFIPPHHKDIEFLYKKLLNIHRQVNRQEECDILIATLLHLLLSDAFSAKKSPKTPKHQSLLPFWTIFQNTTANQLIWILWPRKLISAKTT